jgi:hypothetical protein
MKGKKKMKEETKKVIERERSTKGENEKRRKR